MADQESSAVLGYEQARDELVDVVRRLEAGGATLEESLALWERGEELCGWVGKGGDGGGVGGRRTFSTATERWWRRALASGLSGSAASAACRSA